MGYTCTKRNVIVYLKFTFKWVFYSLTGYSATVGLLSLFLSPCNVNKVPWTKANLQARAPLSSHP